MTESAGYLICPECREEHIRAATHCADCHIELVTPDEVAAIDVEVVELPPASELDCVRVAPLEWVRALSRGLEQAGIAHRIEGASAEDVPEGQDATIFDGARLFGLYVRGEDVAAARELDGAIVAQILPDEAPALEEGEQESCPACGTALAADEVECGECGLRLG
jgi:hypothetical protein